MIETQGEIELRVSRRFEASRERVFDAWTNPEVLRRWWAAGESWDTPLAEVDLRPGGRYRLSMRDPASGAVHTVAGEYTEVEPPERLAYSWAWESESPDGSADSTHVVVEFHEVGDGTEVVLIHSGFVNARAREVHAHGWGECLDNLERKVIRGG